MTSELMAFYSAHDDFGAWRTALAAEDVELRRADDIEEVGRVRHALVWKPPRGFFARFPNLGLVVNLGAGVDALVGRSDLPDVPITRLSDPKMARMMAGYVLFAVLRHARNIPAFERAQRERRWHYIHPCDPETTSVGVLGLGELGLTAAMECARQGFRVLGWSNSPKAVDGIETSAGLEALEAVLRNSDIVVCMLPQTAATRGLLDAGRLAQMRPGASFVNVSRGNIVDEPALVQALRTGHIAEATLDVFATEPMSSESPLWTLDNVLITPHTAGETRQYEDNVLDILMENLARLWAGRLPLKNQIV